MPKIAATDMTGLGSPQVWALAAHDLRQPVQSLLLLTEVMAQSQNARARQRTARHMEDALIVLQTMLDDLSRLARFEARLETPQRTPIKLSDVVATVLHELADLAEAHNVVLTAAVAEVTMLSDAQLLKRIITGLTLNALSLGTGRGICIDSHQNEEDYHLEFRFTGPAIEIAQQNQSFAELRPPTGSTVSQRLTAGLGLLRALAAVIGGKFEYASVTEGTQRFGLVLPSRSAGQILG
jgi:two-component system, sensor histidine kinase